jgi:hypothetical protein
MRCFNGKPEPTAHELAALVQMLADVADAIRELHRPRTPKPKNIDELDWLPPTDWTPESDAEDEGGEDGEVL